MSGRRATLGGVVAVLWFVAACSGGGSDQDSTDVSDPPAATADTPDAESDAESDADSEASTQRRSTFGGVTFEYDTRTVADVTGRRDDAADPVVARVSFDFDFVPGATSETPVESVLVVGDPGQGVPASTSPSSDGDGTSDVVTLAFVNGDGVRSVTGEGDARVYEFAGVTDGDALAVTFGPVELLDDTGDDTVDRLDRLLTTVFVDERSDTFVAAGCVDDAFLVADLTVPDGSVVGAGEEITKTWRLRNSGTCVWGDGYSWTFAGGDPLTLLTVPEIERVAPGEEVDLDVSVRLPETAGVYTAQWHLLGPDGRDVIGPTATLVVEVAAA